MFLNVQNSYVAKTSYAETLTGFAKPLKFVNGCKKDQSFENKHESQCKTRFAHIAIDN